MIWRPHRDVVAGMIETRLAGSSVGTGYVWATCDVENVASARLLESVCRK